MNPSYRTRRMLRVAAASINSTPLDFRGNLQKHKDAILEAKKLGVEMLLFPELAVATGYNAEDGHFLRNSVKKAWDSLGQLACFAASQEHEGYLAFVVGLPVLHNGKLYNGAAVVVCGEIVGIYCKQNLANDGIHYESRWFTPWPAGVVAESSHCSISGKKIPIGDIRIEVNGLRYGFEICEDMFVSGRPAANLAHRGVDVILNPSASHFAFGKCDTRLRIVTEGSRAASCTYVYANLRGNEAGRAIYDGDCLIATNGALVARSERFSYRPFGLIAADVDIGATRQAVVRTCSFLTEVDNGVDLVKSAIGFGAPGDAIVTLPALATYQPALWEAKTGHAKKCEEFARAVALGLIDYLRKSFAKGFFISLSGGADSTAGVVLVYLGLKFAMQELGDGFAEHIGMPALKGQSFENVMGAILHTAYFPTVNSSETTRNSATTVAKTVGASFSVLPVDEIYGALRGGVEEYLGRELSWGRDDLTLQNMGARSRPGIAWGIANALGLLFLTTSNRSESAVGYCTLDGDTSGCLNPIGGIDKEFLRKWLEYVQIHGIDGIGNMPALEVVTKLAPSAELRPLAAGQIAQTDEEDLMPYPILNRIEQLLAVDGFGPIEIAFTLRTEYATEDPETIKLWVKRFFKLFCGAAQVKRDRQAPAFHVDDHNLDSRTWMRWPLVSGGFRDELEELEDLRF